MTTTPDFRALAKELFDQLSAYDGCDDVEEVSQHWNYTNCNELLHRARTALATPPPLAPNYIDPEHHGEDRELLQVFYAACNAEGGTADEIHLRGIRAVMAACAALATPPPEPPPTPDLSALAAIGERLRTQDNRCTAHPAFQVRGLRRIYGMDLDYADEPVWIDNESDCIEVDPPEDPENPGDFIIKTGYQDHWEIIMVAFSEQACLDYIKHNGHRHGVYRELEVYADSFYRCPEMLAIREALMALAGESAPPPEPPTDEEIQEWADAKLGAYQGDPESFGWGWRCFKGEAFALTIRAALERWRR